MKSLTQFLYESSNSSTLEEKAKDFCEAGSWNHAKVSPKDFGDDWFSTIKELDFVKESGASGAQALPVKNGQALVRACLGAGDLEEAYKNWKNAQSGAYWYQGYGRKQKLGYVLECALVTSMGKKLGLDPKKWFEITNLSYDQMKSKVGDFLQKEMVKNFKR